MLNTYIYIYMMLNTYKYLNHMCINKISDYNSAVT